MAPRTGNPPLPSSLEHLCQAAERGRWELVKAALFSSMPSILPDDMSEEYETRLVTEALRQREWHFLTTYVKLLCPVSMETVEDILLAAAEAGYVDFVKETIDQLDDTAAIRPEWVLEILTLTVRNDRHLLQAAAIAEHLPTGTKEEGVHAVATLVEGLETDKAEQKVFLLETLRGIQAEIVMGMP